VPTHTTFGIRRRHREIAHRDHRVHVIETPAARTFQAFVLLKTPPPKPV
jgi:hypothetical protein